MKTFIFAIFLFWVFIVPQIYSHIGVAITKEDEDSGATFWFLGGIVYVILTIIAYIVMGDWEILKIIT